MRKYRFILILAGIYVVNFCDAQDINKGEFSKHPAKEKKTTPKTTNNSKPPRAKSTTATGMVKITANEACTLKINDQDYGNLKAGETKNISLAYGAYDLTARNSKTHDEYQSKLNVKSPISSIQIDVKAVFTEREPKEDSVKNPQQVLAKNATDTVSRNETLQSSQKAAVNKLLSNLVSIPADHFIMGNNLGYNDEGPEHAVTISPIQFGKFEVTQQQWETIMGTNPSSSQECKDCPVENVSWNEIDSFLTKINQISNRTFRLPTEAEWEYIAKKGGESTDLKEQAWFNANSGKKTHPVGTKLPNALGIYDLSGNVAEWCSDWYRLTYYKKKSMNNPVGPSSGKDKVVRGGSFDDTKADLRPYGRNKQNPETKRETTGFRLVMEVK